MICRRCTVGLQLCAVRLQLLQGGKQGAVVGVLIFAGQDIVAKRGEKGPEVLRIDAAERAGCILRCERPDSRISFFCQRCGGDIGSGGSSAGTHPALRYKASSCAGEDSHLASAVQAFCFSAFSCGFTPSMRPSTREPMG